MIKKNFINLKKFENKINFGFFTSIGGVSNNEYFSLNCSKSSKDNKNSVKKNINIALNQLKIKNKSLRLINQIHSNKISFVKNNNMDLLYGDGLITKNKKICLGVLTADCAPIFIFDLDKKIICCLHAGWKGALSNIVKNCVKVIKKEKFSLDKIVAIIGPCLGYKNFEVNKNFKMQFIEKNKSYSEYFKSKNIEKDLFNLRGLINFQLKSEGINKIYNINRDTYKNSHLFFSHRRTTHENRIDTGRMINIISFK